MAKGTVATSLLFLVKLLATGEALITPNAPSAVSPKSTARDPPTSESLDTLLKQLSGYARLPVEEAMTFPPKVYTDPEFFELEKRKIFQPGWLCVAHVSQLRNKGDYMTLDLLGERMVVVNEDGGGTLKVLSRVCTHRFAPVCESGKGTCTTKFTCPFHLWSFDLSGECVAAPFMDEVPGFDRADHPLHEYRSETVGGFVYVNIDGAAEPLSPQITEMTKWLENWETSDADLFVEKEFDCDFNWKIAVETFMECYHHMGAHPTTFEPGFPANLSYAEHPRPAFAVCHARPRPGHEESAFDNGLPFFPKLEGDREKQAFALFNVFPLQLILALPDSVIWHRVIPIAPNKTVFQAHCLVPPATMEMENLEEIREEYAAFMDKFNMEDIKVNVAQQEGAESNFARPGRLNGRMEGALWQLNSFISSKLTGERRP